MKRLLPLILAFLALAAPAAALANTCAWRAESGRGVDALSVSGSCTARKGTVRLTLSCISNTGSATARYDFTLPDGVTGTIARKVSYTGSAPVVKLVRVGSKVSVYVTRAGAGTRTTIQMVTISFYR